MKSAFGSRQFVLFLLAGGVAAGINFFSRILFNLWCSYSVSIILAYLLGMVTAFFLTKVFVFTDSTRELGTSAFYFVLINLVAVLQTWLVSMGLVVWVFPLLGLTWHPHELAHAVGIVVPVFTSFLGHKHLSFR